MHIFISEFFSGGGMSHQDIPGSFLSEGYAMLNAVVNDFKELYQDITITTTLDYRINNYKPPLNEALTYITAKSWVTHMIK